MDQTHKMSKRHKKLGAMSGEDNILLEGRFNGDMWTGQIYMGAWQPIDVAFDTGSDMLMVESHKCINCHGVGNSTGEVYNSTRGTLIADDPKKLEQRMYGQVFL